MTATPWKEENLGPESRKAHQRRVREGFFDRYFRGVVLDIGYRGYEDLEVVPVIEGAIGIDLSYPGYDGKRLPFEEGTVDTVYASHTLEHIDDPLEAIREWFRVLKVGGYLVIGVPHQFLYEKRTMQPSRWNGDHKRFYTPAKLLNEIEAALAPNSYRVRRLIDDDEHYDYTIPPARHAGGAYQIELVVQKIQRPDWILEGPEPAQDLVEGGAQGSLDDLEAKPDIGPQNQESWLSHGLASQAAGHHADAVKAYRYYLAANPGHAEIWAHLGGELVLLERLPEAIEACERALAMNPKDVTGQVNLGLALSKQEQFEQAEGWFLKALVAQPHDSLARLALVECLIQTNRLSEVAEQLERVLALDPMNEHAFRRLAQVHHLNGDREGLLRTLDRWVTAIPDSPDCMWERGALRMLVGRFREGWNDFEARLEMREQPRTPIGPFAQPRWNGEPFPGKTLLLHWEQGFGDTLMFIRFARQAKDLGGRVVACVHPPLARLIATCDGLDEVVPHGAPLPPFDLYLPLMSLPWLFGTDEASIPADVPYLGIPEQTPNREALQRILSIPTERVRIGYAWAGNSGNRADHTRSMPPEKIARLEALPGVAWHCFQLPAPAALPLRSVPLGELLKDFSDTAFALSYMDLVLTVDTALAHLAGALGIPVFLMLRYGSEWRWQLERQDSPWYPTMRIYRQTAPGDWDSVIDQILEDLGGGQERV